MQRDDLATTAARMVAPGKGILAADESPGTIRKRFEAVGVTSTADARRDYRELLLRATEAMREAISGVILHDETFRQKAADESSLVSLIENTGALAGIKVDLGAHPLPGCPDEVVTEGLDGLGARLAEYRELGARFAKWRAVIALDAHRPSDHAIAANAHALARYAAHCQSAGLVPIVEPEVLMDGDHDLAHCYAVTKRVLHRVFCELHEARVALEGIVLKPNMVVAGAGHARKPAPEDVAHATIKALRTCVPAAVPGIAFLSGGQEEVEATANLNAINSLGPQPWALTFSFGRALQASAQAAWQGKAQNAEAAQRAFAHRARMNSLAARGEWSANAEGR